MLRPQVHLCSGRVLHCAAAGCFAAVAAVNVSAVLVAGQSAHCAVCVLAALFVMVKVVSVVVMRCKVQVNSIVFGHLGI
jgi:hypothetical protein